MSVAALERLETCHRALIAALDASDIDALEAALRAFPPAIEAVRSVGAWRDEPEVRARAASLLNSAEAARVRVNYLTDLTRRRLDRLALMRGHGGTYAARKASG